MPNVDVFVTREKVLPTKVKVKTRYVVDGVTRPERQTTWPDDVATWWALLSDEERAELAQEWALRYVRERVERIG